MHLVSLAPAYSQINAGLEIILGGIALWITAWGTAWLNAHKKLLGEQLTAQLADGLNRALENGVAIALQIPEQLEAKYPSLPVQSQITAWAAQYAIDHSPDAMAKFGISPQDLAIKALAYLPPVATTQGLTGATIKTTTVTQETLPPIT